MKLLSVSLLSLLLVLHHVSASADTVSIAVASNFTAAMNELISSFETDSGHDVQVTYGSSGRFYAQIINGAPFDIFFSADQEKPALLDTSVALPDSRFTYAIGALVLWSKSPGLPLEQAALIRQGGFNKLALANPGLAPYGQAALEVLTRLGLANSSREHWVRGENITQVFQFVDSGNADLGFVALSQVIQNQAVAGSVWRVPAELHEPIKQDAILLSRAQNNQAARDFLSFMQSGSAKNIIAAFGYSVEAGE